MTFYITILNMRSCDNRSHGVKVNLKECSCFLIYSITYNTSYHRSRSTYINSSRKKVWYGCCMWPMSIEDDFVNRLTLGPSSLIAISMYQRFEASDISPIQSFGVSIQLRHTLTLLLDTEIGFALINAGIETNRDR